MGSAAFDSNVYGVPAVRASGTSGAFGVYAKTDGAWTVTGDNPNGVSVFASSGGPIAALLWAVQGQGAIVRSNEGPEAARVEAMTDGDGIVATSHNGRAVLATSEDGPAMEAASDRGPGLYANSNDFTGVYAYSVNNRAIYATSGSSDAIAGYAQEGGSAVVGYSPNGTAGLFLGPVFVTGALTVYGPKSAAVRHPDGSHRRLYSMESPQSWLEDFGTGELHEGTGEVQIDRDFAQLVDIHEYYVFLTPLDGCRGLYVSNKSPTSFEVREAQQGTHTLKFDYRLVAKRRDIEGRRLERVSDPSAFAFSMPEVRERTSPAPPVTIPNLPETITRHD
jgi:hypothetical protein